MEQWGEVEYQSAVEQQLREAEASERAAEEAADEDKVLAKQRIWDDWLDDNPRGWGNSKLRPCG